MIEINDNIRTLIRIKLNQKLFFEFSKGAIFNIQRDILQKIVVDLKKAPFNMVENNE